MGLLPYVLQNSIRMKTLETTPYTTRAQQETHKQIIIKFPIFQIAVYLPVALVALGFTSLHQLAVVFIGMSLQAPVVQWMFYGCSGVMFIGCFDLCFNV